jgi:hypothetical protein
VSQWATLKIIARPQAYKGVAPDFFASAIVGAKRIFAGIMTSEWKDRLCKCRHPNCGLYFLHDKPRQSYRSGTFCGHEHSKNVAATLAMYKTRTHGQEELIEEAARQLLNGGFASPEWQDNSERKCLLAAALSLAIPRMRLQGYKQDVKVNWVTRHQALIEQKRVELAGDWRTWLTTPKGQRWKAQLNTSQRQPLRPARRSAQSPPPRNRTRNHT